MEVYRSIDEVGKNRNIIAILGNFDGMHEGHMTLLETAKEFKSEDDLLLVVTFDPHPKEYNGVGIKKLYTIEEKLEAFLIEGVDVALLLPFGEVVNLSPEDFVKKYLVDGLDVKKVVIGYNYHFGKRASGCSEDMESFGQEFGFDVIVVPEYMKGGINVSSSVIRDLLEDCDIKGANSLLGYSFSIEGRVIHGKGLGKKLGFPTANLKVKEDKIWPGLGVYGVYGLIDDKCYYGICNVGFQPTIDGGFDKKVIEVNFFDFSDDIYDETIRIYFIDFLREIKRFDSKEGLIGQLSEDREKTLDLVKVFCD